MMNFNNRSAILALADGCFFWGQSQGYGDVGKFVVGEVVFNTSMSGYQEILTDASYHSQIINFTHPNIGNTGINNLDIESNKVFARGLIARNLITHFSSHHHWRATQSLGDFLIDQKVVAIDQVDTRAVTRYLRDYGVQAGCILIVDSAKDESSQVSLAVSLARQFGGVEGSHLAPLVSSDKSAAWDEGAWQSDTNDYKSSTLKVGRRIVVIDCGVKKNILRLLVARDCVVTILPYEVTIEMILAKEPDGVLISNGPGDPCASEHLQVLAGELLARQIPLFGLCLGHQVVALALGAKVEKMKFGHHGANHPVQSSSGEILITSQNHGFAVDIQSLPKTVFVSHRSLFDGSLQGLRGYQVPVMTFQGHPESSPGPDDAVVLFDDFIRLVDKHAQMH